MVTDLICNLSVWGRKLRGWRSGRKGKAHDGGKVEEGGGGLFGWYCQAHSNQANIADGALLQRVQEGEASFRYSNAIYIFDISESNKLIKAIPSSSCCLIPTSASPRVLQRNSNCLLPPGIITKTRSKKPWYSKQREVECHSKAIEHRILSPTSWKSKYIWDSLVITK